MVATGALLFVVKRRARHAQEFGAASARVYRGIEAANVAAIAKTLVEHLASLADGFLEGGDGARLEGQFRLELATVEQLGVHLGHRVTFLSSGGLSECGQAEVRGMVSSLRRVKIS